MEKQMRNGAKQRYDWDYQSLGKKDTEVNKQ